MNVPVNPGMNGLAPSPSTSSLDARSPSPAFSTMSSPAATSSKPTLPASKARGMQLGANKTPANVAAAVELAEWDAQDETHTAVDAWGGDLMDVNADADDWSMALLIFLGNVMAKLTVLS